MDAIASSLAQSQGPRARARRRVDQLHAVLERQIDEGRLKPGERLATERELADRYGASRNVVRAALAELHKAGKILRHVGRGTVVVSPPQTPRGSDGALLPDASPVEMMEFRLALEPGLARAVVLHASDSDLQAIKECVDRGEEASRWEEWEHWDSSFHRRIVAATHNRLTIGVYEAVIAVRRQSPWGQIKQHTVDQAKWRVFQTEHRRILDALLARNGEAAADAIQGHLRHARAKMLGY